MTERMLAEAQYLSGWCLDNPELAPEITRIRALLDVLVERLKDERDDGLFVVKSRRIIRGKEVASVVTAPASVGTTRARLDDLNERYQTPGTYYMEKWGTKA